MNKETIQEKIDMIIRQTDYNKETAETKFIEFNNDEEIEQIIKTVSIDNCKRITNNANKFVKNYLKKNFHEIYMAELIYYLTLNNCIF